MAETHPESSRVDLFIIGGGVNGTGIARDAAGRGLSVALAEKDDLAQATSSASTKLIHGGLRYLEFFDVRLVRESLRERDVLLRMMPHIARPMRFVLPLDRKMRFDTTTPASRLLSTIMPWMKGRRPGWMIRIGLFLYDHLGGKTQLPGTRSLDLTKSPEGLPLKPRFRRAFEYSDCAVQDARLVVLNARDAANNGATIMTRSQVVSAERVDGEWLITLRRADGGESHWRAKALINAAGPWVGEVVTNVVRGNATESVRLVRGSHIVVPRLYYHEKCYFFQGSDGRIIFAIPYEGQFTLIGTTEVDHDDLGQAPACTEGEAQYLCNFASDYFKTAVTTDDIVWTYSGVRPLYDDGESSATAATREYVLRIDDDGAPLLNVFGGKITTYRRLAEDALEMLAPFFPQMDTKSWTYSKPLPGGDFSGDFDAEVARLCDAFPFLDQPWAARLIGTYGTDAHAIFGVAKTKSELGQDFGATITERELEWVVANEWVQTGEDFLWRRTKMGLHLNDAEVAEVSDFLARMNG